MHSEYLFWLNHEISCICVYWIEPFGFHLGLAFLGLWSLTDNDLFEVSRLVLLSRHPAIKGVVEADTVVPV
ncbi:MAG: hypothetical protein ACRCW3_00755, partial [Metamycoplasmataceae bacterium]